MVISTLDVDHLLLVEHRALQELGSEGLDAGRCRSSEVRAQQRRIVADGACIQTYGAGGVLVKGGANHLVCIHGEKTRWHPGTVAAPTFEDGVFRTGCIQGDLGSDIEIGGATGIADQGAWSACHGAPAGACGSEGQGDTSRHGVRCGPDNLTVPGGVHRKELEGATVGYGDGGAVFGRSGCRLGPVGRVVNTARFISLKDYALRRAIGPCSRGRRSDRRLCVNYVGCALDGFAVAGGVHGKEPESRADSYRNGRAVFRRSRLGLRSVACVVDGSRFADGKGYRLRRVVEPGCRGSRGNRRHGVYGPAKGCRSRRNIARPIFGPDAEVVAAIGKIAVSVRTRAGREARRVELAIEDGAVIA